jgi:hypothetical protein
MPTKDATISRNTRDQSEGEMRALYKFLGLSDVTTEAAVALRRQTPVIEARAKQLERFQRRHKTGGKHK